MNKELSTEKLYALLAAGKARAFHLGIGRRPLLGRQNIFYVPLPETTDHARFMRLFQETWRMIPFWARRELCAEWRPLKVSPPLVEVTSCWKLADGKVFGSWNLHHQFHFWSNAVNAMPDDILSILIAHELAHPVNRILWRKWYPERFEVPKKLILKPTWEVPEEHRGSPLMDGEEIDTRELQDSWGFDEEKLCDWEEANASRLKQEWEQEQAALAEEVKAMFPDLEVTDT